MVLDIPNVYSTYTRPRRLEGEGGVRCRYTRFALPYSHPDVRHTTTNVTLPYAS